MFGIRSCPGALLTFIHFSSVMTPLTCIVISGILGRQCRISGVGTWRLSLVKTELYCFARISAYSCASSQSLPFPLQSGMPTLSRLLDSMYDHAFLLSRLASPVDIPVSYWVWASRSSVFSCLSNCCISVPIGIFFSLLCFNSCSCPLLFKHRRLVLIRVSSQFCIIILSGRGREGYLIRKISWYVPLICWSTHYLCTFCGNI